MNERQRTEYLEAMGIHVFVPRWILPAAAPSVQAPLPAAHVQPAVEQALDHDGGPPAERQPRKEAGQQVTGLVSDIIGELAGKESVRSGQSSAPADPASSPAKRVLDVLGSAPPVEAVHFSLTLWRVSESLLVIDSHQARQALPTGALLGNMLFAKGLRTQLPSSEVLGWPMVGSKEGEGGWEQASEMVLAFLNARFERQPVQYVWLMGEAAYRAVYAGESDYQESIGQLRDLTTLGCSGVVLPSLADMLKSPSLKAPAWQAIKAHRVG